ncbi:MAG: BlaI/MecI/CopY family transcriptional regulator [Acidobacteriota bacterium]
MAKKATEDLSRRERQIMDIVYRCERVTAAEVREQLPQAPGYSTVRTLLRILEEKGHLKHVRDGMKYVYQPTVSRTRARRSALENVVRTFFEGSTEKAVTALLDMSETELSDEERRRLVKRIRTTREEGR